MKRAVLTNSLKAHRLNRVPAYDEGEVTQDAGTQRTLEVVNMKPYAYV